MRRRAQKSHRHGSVMTGFTLLELLVVIAIIGLLSSIVFTSLSSVRVRARDARRKMDLAEVRKALELYYDDNNAYPGGTPPGCLLQTLECWAGSYQNKYGIKDSKRWVADDQVNCALSYSTYDNTVLDKYFPSGLPTDPNGKCCMPDPTIGTTECQASRTAMYSYQSNGDSYKLQARLEETKTVYELKP